MTCLMQDRVRTRQGPGQKLLDVINESIGDKKIIAEDLRC